MKTPFDALSRIATPLGSLTLAATARGLAGAWFDAQKHHPGELQAPNNAAQQHLQQAEREFSAYFERRSLVFSVALDPQGTAFQQQVWQALLQIAPGALSSYGEIARRVGRPEAARAVGAAVGRNPIAIIVPCHRVIGRDGSLTGYAAGLPRKQALLALEGVRTGELFELG
jgi:methylated-DNA-[protein]-cysteine S-methyltransferase